MRISDFEAKRIGQVPGSAIVDMIARAGQEHDRVRDQAIVQAITRQIEQMPDRDDLVEEIRAQIAAGQYNPSSEEIVTSMLRRAVADTLEV